MSLPLLQKDNYRKADSMDLFKWEKILSLILGIWTEGDTPAGRRFPPKRNFWWKPEGEEGVSQHYFPPFPNLLSVIHMGRSLVTAIITEGTVIVPAKAVSRIWTRDLLEQIEISAKEFKKESSGLVGTGRQKTLCELFTWVDQHGGVKEGDSLGYWTQP